MCNFKWMKDTGSAMWTPCWILPAMRSATGAFEQHFGIQASNLWNIWSAVFRDSLLRMIPGLSARIWMTAGRLLGGLLTGFKPSLFTRHLLLTDIHDYSFIDTIFYFIYHVPSNKCEYSLNNIQLFLWFTYCMVSSEILKI